MVACACGGPPGAMTYTRWISLPVSSSRTCRVSALLLQHSQRPAGMPTARLGRSCDPCKPLQSHSAALMRYGASRAGGSDAAFPHEALSRAGVATASGPDALLQVSVPGARPVAWTMLPTKSHPQRHRKCRQGGRAQAGGDNYGGVPVRACMPQTLLLANTCCAAIITAQLLLLACHAAAQGGSAPGRERQGPAAGGHCHCSQQRVRLRNGWALRGRALASLAAGRAPRGPWRPART